MICPGTKRPESVSFRQKSNVSIVKLIQICERLFIIVGMNGDEFKINSGNKLEGDWGEIVALGAEISP